MSAASLDIRVLVTVLNFIAEYFLVLYFFSPLVRREKRSRSILGSLTLLLIFILYFRPFNEWERVRFAQNMDFLVQMLRLFYYYIVVWVYLMLSKEKSAGESGYLSLYYIAFYGISRIYQIIVSLLTSRLTAAGANEMIVLSVLSCVSIGLEYFAAWLVHRMVPLKRIFPVRPFHIFLVGGVTLLSVFFRYFMRTAAIWQDAEPGMLLFPLCTILAFTLFLVFFESWDISETERRQLSVQKALRSLELEHSAAATEADRQVRQLYHDMKNHLLAIRSMNASDSDIQDYVDSILGRLEPYELQVRTGIPYMDAYVSEKVRHMERMGIRYRIDLNLTDLNTMEPTDLVSIVGNSLDNAIEALELVPEEEHILSATSSRFANTILLCFTNNFSGKIEWGNGLPTTRKPDKEYHGIGLRAIQNVAGDYGGSIAIDLDPKNRQFKLTIMIPVSSET